MVKTSNIRASAQVATTHHASELWLATQCGDPRGSPATDFPDVFWGSDGAYLSNMVNICEHLWHAQAATCNSLNARYMFFCWYLRCTWKCSLPYATNTWSIRPGGLQRTTEGPNSEHPIKINQRYQKVLGLDCFIISEWKYWLVFPINYENNREYRLVVSLFSPLLGMITYSTSIHSYSLE